MAKAHVFLHGRNRTARDLPELLLRRLFP